MKKLFFAVCALCACAGFAQDKTLEWVKRDLEKARIEYAAFQKTRESGRAELLGKLKSASADVAAERARISGIAERDAEMASLSEKSKFLDALSAEILSTSADLSKSFGLRQSSAFSIPEIVDVSERAIVEARGRVFEPLKLREAEARIPKGSEKLSGKFFRVGAQRYFVSGERAGFLSEDFVLYGEKYAPRIRDFADGKIRRIPVDMSGGTMLELERVKRGFADEVRLGGVWIYPILFFGILSAAVFIVKLARFARIRRAPKTAVAKIMRAIESGDDSAAARIASRAGYPYGGMLSELVRSRKLSAPMLEEISYEYMLSAGERLFSGLSVLSVSAAVSPLFGLLGTVTGIIRIFSDLSFRSAEQAQFISEGISEALITTEYGLVVAIPAFVAHALLSRRAKAVLSDMEKLASSFISGNSKK